jgi:DNA-binding transcriptional LysR family regulator
MSVVMAVGHPLASHHELAVADVIGEPFPRADPSVDPDWAAFWTLDARRGAPPATAPAGDAGSVAQGLAVVASGRAIGTAADWVASGLPHPGVVALPLRDGPHVETCFVWRSGDDRPTVRGLVDLAHAWRVALGTNGDRPDRSE